MTGRSLLTSLLFCSLASLSLADDIVVRAGEHEDFTRLVLQIPRGVTWDLEKENGLVRFEFEGLQDRFDTSQTFSIIPQTRLRDVRADDGLLTLNLACDCPVVTYFENAEYLIVDIQDGPPLPTPVTLPPRAQPKKNDPIPRSEFSQFELLWRDTVPSTPPQIERKAADEEVENAASVDAREKEVFLETQRALLEAFGEAVSRGVVSVESGGVAAVLPSEPEQDVEVYDSSARPEPGDVSPSGHIRVTSSNDLPPNGETEILLEAFSSEYQCLNAQVLNVASWVPSEDFSSHLGQSNQMLYDELGRLDQAAALKRTKLYLYFGFGQEAGQTAQLIDNFSNLHPELADMAQILEYGYASNPRSLHRFAECNSDLALWGILAAEELPNDAPVNAAAAILALEKLPEHLRGVLGQQLSLRLLDLGYKEFAGAALRASTRTQESARPTLAEAHLGSSNTSAEQQADALIGVTSSNTADGPEAVIDLVNNYVDRSSPVPADIALLVEAYLFEFQDAPIAAELLHAHALAASASGQIDKAFSAMKDLSTQGHKEKATSAANHLLSTLTSLDSSVEFLRNMMERGDSLGTGLDSDAVYAAAARLLELGFSEASRAIIDQAEDMPPLQVKTLSASTYLAEDNATAALAALEGLNDANSTLLRATALAQAGDNNSARTSFVAAERPDLARTSAWLSDQWRDAIDPADETFGGIAGLAAEELPPVLQNDVMIQNSLSAANSSEAARATIQRLLQDLDLTE